MNRTAMFVMRMAGLAVVAATVAGSPAWARSNRDAEASHATITLHVYDYAQVNRATLAAAEREASRILAQAGVTTQWQECPTSHDASKAFRGCAAPQAGDYIVSILPNAHNLAGAAARIDGRTMDGVRSQLSSRVLAPRQ
jgi:hypothetical protein